MEKTKKALLSRLDTALRNIYHNATPHYPNVPQGLWEQHSEWFNFTAQNEIEYMQSLER